MPASAASLAFVTIELVVMAAAGLAAVGAALTGIVVLRSARRRPADAVDAARRRAPSPASVGLADDPIVAALRARRRHSMRRQPGPHVDSSDPPT